MKNVLLSGTQVKALVKKALFFFAAKLAGFLTNLLFPGKQPAYQVIPTQRKGSATDKLKDYRDRF